jgi:hypothetical protein
MMITLPDAKALIAPAERDLVGCHQTAVKRWTDFLTQMPDLSGPLTSTTRANFISNHVCSEILRCFDASDDIQVVDGLGFLMLLFPGAVLLRFKFVGQGAPSNVATRQQKNLARQSFTAEMLQAVGCSDELTPPTTLTCGYTLADDQLGRVEIRRDCKGHKPWFYDIYGGETVAEPLPLDGLADDTKPARVASTSKPKKGNEAQAQEA